MLESFALAQWSAKNLPLRFFGDRVLREHCTPVTEIEIKNGTIQKIIDELIDTLTKYRAHTGMGRGLAANQIGHSKRIVLVYLENNPTIFVNPKLISSVGEGSYEESCLSSGSLLIGEIHRPWQGTFEYLTPTGQHKTLNADHRETRVLLHEIDHLNGILCTDKYEPKTLRIIHNGKTEVGQSPFIKLR